MTFLSTRLNRIQPSPTLSMAANATKMKESGIDVISLSIGEPDFDTPIPIQEAATHAMQSGMTKYTPVGGVTALKIAIQKKFKNENNLDYDVSQIIAGTGGKQIIFNAFMATIESGDEVIIPAPYWVSYPDIVSLFEGKPVFVPCLEENNFKILPHQLEAAITPKTKWFVLNAPSNPTGEVYSEEELKSLGTVLEKHPHVHIMCDDIYEHLVYDNLEFKTLAAVCPALKDRILIVNGVSKSYSMTGWRLGYGAGSADLIKAMLMLQSQSTSNPSSISQAAAIEAINGDQSFLDEWRESFIRRRNLVWEHINKIPGLSCRKPGGAFYLYVNCAALIGKKTPDGKIIQNDNELATYFLEQAHVAVVSGDAFGLSPYFRISYSTSDDILVEACNRIRKSVEDLA